MSHECFFERLPRELQHAIFELAASESWVDLELRRSVDVVELRGEVERCFEEIRNGVPPRRRAELECTATALQRLELDATSGTATARWRLAQLCGHRVRAGFLCDSRSLALQPEVVYLAPASGTSIRDVRERRAWRLNFDPDAVLDDYVYAMSARWVLQRPVAPVAIWQTSDNMLVTVARHELDARFVEVGRLLPSTTSMRDAPPVTKAVAAAASLVCVYDAMLYHSTAKNADETLHLCDAARVGDLSALSVH